MLLTVFTCLSSPWPDLQSQSFTANPKPWNEVSGPWVNPVCCLVSAKNLMVCVSKGTPYLALWTNCRGQTCNTEAETSITAKKWMSSYIKKHMNLSATVLRPALRAGRTASVQTTRSRLLLKCHSTPFGYLLDRSKITDMEFTFQLLQLLNVVITAIYSVVNVWL